MPDVFSIPRLDEIAKKYQANPLGTPTLPEIPDDPVFDTSRLDEIAKKYAPIKPKSQPASGITRDRERYIPPGAENWSIDSFDQIGSRYRQQFGQAIPTRAFGQGNIHNSQGWDHRNAVDVPVDPNSERGKWILNDLRTNNVPFQAMYRAIKNPTTGRISSTGPHIHIGLPSHSTNERFPVGTRRGPQISSTFAEPKLDIGRLDEIAAKYKAPVPEHPETLTAQVQSAARPDSPKLGMLVTPGAKPPSIPSGFTMVETSKGKLYFDPAKVKAAGITDPVAQMDRILGTVEPVADTSQGNAVVARDANGRELEAKIVTTPETAQAQAKVNARMHPDSVQSVEPAQSVVARRQQARKVPIRHIPTASERVEGFFRNAPLAPRQPNATVGRVGQTSPRTLSPEAGAAAGDVRALLTGGSEGLQQRRIAQRGSSPRAISMTGRSTTISNADAQALGLPRRQEPIELGRGVEYNKPAHQIASEKAAQREHEQFVQTLTPKEQASIDTDVNELVNSTRVGGGLKAGLSGSIARTDLTAAGIMDWLNLGGKPGESDPLSARRQGQIRLEVLRRAADKLPESTLRGLAELAGGTPLDILRLAALSKLPGGAVTGFGIDSAAQAAGEGRPAREVVARGAQGALTGGVFHGAGGKSLIPRLATIGAGTAAVDTAFNGGLDPKSILTNMLFGAIPGGKGEARPGEPVIRENRITEPDGPVAPLEPLRPRSRQPEVVPERPVRREVAPTPAPTPVEAVQPKETVPIATPESYGRARDEFHRQQGTISWDELTESAKRSAYDSAIQSGDLQGVIYEDFNKIDGPQHDWLPSGEQAKPWVASKPAPERVTPKLVEPEPPHHSELQNRSEVGQFEPGMKPEPDTRFASNKIFTADKVAEARARISAKAKGSQLNVGLDPELAKDYAVVGAAHIEAGARRFGEWSKQMVNDFGDEIKPHLDRIYRASRDAHDYEKEVEVKAPKVHTPEGIRQHGETMRRAGLTETPDVEYDPQTVEGWKSDAKATVNELGVEGAIRHYKDLPDGDSGGKYSLGDELLNRLTPGTEEFTDLARHQIEHAGEAGQTLRAAAEVSRRDPRNAVKYAEMAKQRATRRGNSRPGQGLTPDEAERIQKRADVQIKANERTADVEQRIEAVEKTAKPKAKPVKVTYEVALRDRSTAALEKLKGRKLTFGRSVPEGERGAVKFSVERGPLKGDGELVAEYVAGRLRDFESTDALRKELVKEFGADVESHVIDIRDRAHTIRAEARREAMQSAPERKESILSEIQREVREANQALTDAEKYDKMARQAASRVNTRGQTEAAQAEARAAREAQTAERGALAQEARESAAWFKKESAGKTEAWIKSHRRELQQKRESQLADAKAKRAEQREIDKQERRRARAEANMAKFHDRAESDRLVKEARQRKALVASELTAARKAEQKGYRETIRTQKEKDRLAGTWDAGIRQVATEARERLKDATDPKDPLVHADLVAVAREHWLADEQGGAPRTRAVGPSAMYEFINSFPNLKLTKRQAQRIYTDSLESVQDTTQAARTLARERNASKESAKLWDQFWEGEPGGADVSAQALLLQRADVQRVNNDLRIEQQRELEQLTAGPFRKAFNAVGGSMRGLKSSVDLPTGRQGLPGLLAHPLATIKTIPAGIKAYGMGRGAWETYQKEFQQRPGFDVARDAMGIKFDQTEEQFYQSPATRLPHVKRSEQGYSAQMNEQRLAIANIYAHLGELEGYTPKSNPQFYKEVGRIVNVMTGRGDLTTRQKAFSQWSQDLLFSPRLNISRLQMMKDALTLPFKWKDYDPVTRRIYARNLITTAAMMSATYALGKIAGFDIGVNPMNPDFGKIRVGNTRYDPTGGNAAMVRALVVLAMKAGLAHVTGRALGAIGQQVKSTNAPLSGPVGNYLQSGQDELKETKTGFYPTVIDLGKQFRYKLAPLPSAMLEVGSIGLNAEEGKGLTGKDAVGQPVTVVPDIHNPIATAKTNIFLRMIEPMVTGDFLDAYEDRGPKGLLMALPSLGGFGVGTYPDRDEDKPKKKTGGTISTGTTHGTTRHGTPHTTTTRSGSTPRGPQPHVP